MIKAALRELKNLSSPSMLETFSETIMVIALSAFGFGLIFLADYIAKNIIFKII